MTPGIREHLPGFFWRIKSAEMQIAGNWKQFRNQISANQVK